MEINIDNASDDEGENVISGVTKKSDYLPLADVIEKFHRIRESHVKRKHNVICEHFRTESQADVSVKREGDTVSGNPNRPNSARLGLCKQLKSEIGSSRRRSLPSIFHPSSVTQDLDGVDGLVVKQDVRDKKQAAPVGVSCGLSRRRFSLPYVIKEYAKKDIDELEYKLTGQKGDALRDTKDIDSETKKDSGINGKDLHAFYNIWKSQIKPTRIRIPRRLDALLRENDIDNSSEGRTRGFSF